MTTRPKTNFSLLLMISLYLHVVIIVAAVMPDLSEVFQFMEKTKNRMFDTGRTIDFITNLNEDNKVNLKEKLFISDRTSAARGHLTRTRGKNWSSSTKDFIVSKSRKAETGKGRKVVLKSTRETFLLNDNSEVVIQLQKGALQGEKSKYGRFKIPRTDLITRENSIFYTNTGQFSFNSIKALTKEELEWMRNWGRVFQSNFFPPLLANSALGGYAPGRVRIMAIPNQVVKGFHIMDKSGNVKLIQILDSRGDPTLNVAIKEALKNGRFGTVPKRFLNEKGYFGSPFVIYYIVR